MPQMILRVAVALVAFGAGLAASTLFNAVFGSSPATNRYEYTRPTTNRRPCPNSFRSMSELPPSVIAEPVVPQVPDVPPPPPPATTKTVIKKRLTVKLPDGTVRVIESNGETFVKKL